MIIDKQYMEDLDNSIEDVKNSVRVHSKIVRQFKIQLESLELQKEQILSLPKPENFDEI